jgi:ketosteroid isomerase-like protein
MDIYSLARAVVEMRPVIGEDGPINAQEATAMIQDGVLKNDEAELRTLITRWAQAVRDKDMAGIRADHDPDILMFDVPPPLLSRGIEDYMASWPQFLNWSTKPMKFEFSDLEIVAGEDVAFATAVGHCNGNEEDGEPEELLFRLTMGFRKQNGRWRIVHEHHSVPAPA